MNGSDYITRTDLKAELDLFADKVIKAAVKEMSEIFREGMQMIAERFNEVDKRFDRIDERLDRMEDKLDRTAAQTDLHAVDIRQLKRKADLA